MLDIYSGSENPTWILKDVEQVVMILEKVEAIQTLQPVSHRWLKALGYQGVLLSIRGDKVQDIGHTGTYYTHRVFNGFLTSIDSNVNYREKNRELERYLLQTARGTLDDLMIDAIISEF